MRDNGFLSAAHALSELIDNSIQSGASIVELIAFEKKRETSPGQKAIKYIEKIGVLDNGSGMSKETLHLALEFGASENRKDGKGIGKFGMGLPNSSISQCQHVDVWSWKSKDKILYTYLDIEEIKNGSLETIPEPVEKAIPGNILSSLVDSFPETGTLVVWSKIDRCQWKTGKSIHRHTQDIVGRMYRKFIENGQVSIRFKLAELKGDIYVVDSEEPFLANDPMYLMKNTSLKDLPGDFCGESMFEICEEYPFEIADENGIKRTVTITGTYIKRSVVDAIRKTTSGYIGGTDWGKAAAKNYGLSIMRSGRELSLAAEFIDPKGARERGRWYGIQISFDPDLDNIFGVTNNKQHVVNLRMVRVADDYEREGFDSEQEYRSDLLANNDPKLRIYEVVWHIKEMEKKLNERLLSVDFKGTKASAKGEGIDEGIDPATRAANEKNEERETIHPTSADKPTEADITETLQQAGSKNPEESAKTIMENQLRVWIEEVPMSTNAFFDVTTKKGLTLLQINSNHVFTKRILNNVPPSQREAIEVCLAGWARMERECSSEKKLRQLQMARKDWGQLLDDFLDDEE
jgi:hypothetical protein